MDDRRRHREHEQTQLDERRDEQEPVVDGAVEREVDQGHEPEGGDGDHHGSGQGHKHRARLPTLVGGTITA